MIVSKNPVIAAQQLAEAEAIAVAERQLQAIVAKHKPPVGRSGSDYVEGIVERMVVSWQLQAAESSMFCGVPILSEVITLLRTPMVFRVVHKPGNDTLLNRLFAIRSYIKNS